jgi:acyl-CoA dehydrogenase
VAMTEAGYLGALIPEKYGGMGLDLSAGCAILGEVNLSGANAGPAHAQMYTMGTLLRHGSEEQKRQYLPKIARGDLRLQAFAVTEPEAGTDTTSIRTTATREGDHYVVNGRKIYISRVEQSDLMILLARTTPIEERERHSSGLSVFLVDLREVEARDDEQRDQRASLRRPTASCGKHYRRRGKRFPLHHRWHER